MHPWLNWIEHRPPKAGTARSNRAGCAKKYCPEQGALHMKRFAIFILPFTLAACNSMSIKPNTLDADQTFYATRGGYTMKRSIKERMESRGYRVVVGRTKTMNDYSGDAYDIAIDKDEIPSDVRYIVRVVERREKFNPLWCPLNGFWWWNFNVSIADQKTGEELMTWRGRGCQNSSLRKLDAALDKLEMPKPPLVTE